MKTIFLLLLLFVCANASLLNWRKVNKLRKTLAKLEAHLDMDRLLAIREKLDSHLKAPEMNPQQLTFLEQRLKEIKPAKVAKSDSIAEVNEESGISEILYQGDMVLTEEQAEELIEEEDGARERRQAYANKKYKWPGKLYFSFYPNTKAKTKAVARKGAKLWHDNTCVDMIENSKVSERVAIYEGSGCHSYVGNLHQLQNLSLAAGGCTLYWIAAHELGHALGLKHVQARYDRDKYVKINVGNIPEDKRYTFAKTSKEEFSTYNIPYDFGSRMHYGAYDFAANQSKPTIIPHDGNFLHSMGSPFLSFYDFLLMNTHYGCLEKCKSKSSAAKCTNGGYPNPRNCSKCICPRGYGGVTCNERPQAKTCGKTVTASSKMQTITHILGNKKNTTVLDDFKQCYYWIKNPQKKKVKLTINDLGVRYVNVNCNYGGVEIKAQEDQKMSGYRFCDYKENKGKVVTSSSKIIPVILYTRFGATELKLNYKIGM